MNESDFEPTTLTAIIRLETVMRRFVYVRFMPILAAGLLVIFLTVHRAASAAEAPLIQLKDAPKHENQIVQVEIKADSYKYARRRQMHFLYGTSNFRSGSAIIVAVRDQDLQKWKEADRDLKGRYQGHSIRAQGKLMRDEEQWLVTVTAPEQIQPLDNVKKIPVAAKLLIRRENGDKIELPVPLDSALARTRVALEHEGQVENYEGVLLATVLEKAKITLGADNRGPLLARYFVVTSGDGYTVVASLGEVDPYLGSEPILLAESRDGKPLPQAEGPLLLVVPRDKRHRRWVSNVSVVEVRSAILQKSQTK